MPLHLCHVWGDSPQGKWLVLRSVLSRQGGFYDLICSQLAWVFPLPCCEGLASHRREKDPEWCVFIRDGNAKWGLDSREKHYFKGSIFKYWKVKPLKTRRNVFSITQNASPGLRALSSFSVVLSWAGGMLDVEHCITWWFLVALSFNWWAHKEFPYFWRGEWLYCTILFSWVLKISK